MEQPLWLLVEWLEADSPDTKEYSSYGVVNAALIDTNVIREGKMVKVRDGDGGRRRAGQVLTISEAKSYVEAVRDMFLKRDAKVQHLVSPEDPEDLRKSYDHLLPNLREKPHLDAMRRRLLMDLSDSDEEQQRVPEWLDLVISSSEDDGSIEMTEEEGTDNTNAGANAQDTPSNVQSDASQEPNHSRTNTSSERVTPSNGQSSTSQASSVSVHSTNQQVMPSNAPSVPNGRPVSQEMNEASSSCATTAAGSSQEGECAKVTTDHSTNTEISQPVKFRNYQGTGSNCPIYETIIELAPEMHRFGYIIKEGVLHRINEYINLRNSPGGKIVCDKECQIDLPYTDNRNEVTMEEDNFSAQEEWITDTPPGMVRFGRRHAVVTIPKQLLHEIDWSSYKTAAQSLLKAAYPSLPNDMSTVANRRRAGAEIHASVVDDIADMVSEVCEIRKSIIWRYIACEYVENMKLYQHVG